MKIWVKKLIPELLPRILGRCGVVGHTAKNKNCPAREAEVVAAAPVVAPQIGGQKSSILIRTYFKMKKNYIDVILLKLRKYIEHLFKYFLIYHFLLLHLHDLIRRYTQWIPSSDPSGVSGKRMIGSLKSLHSDTLVSGRHLSTSPTRRQQYRSSHYPRKSH